MIIRKSEPTIDGCREEFVGKRAELKTHRPHEYVELTPEEFEDELKAYTERQFKLHQRWKEDVPKWLARGFPIK